MNFIIQYPDGQRESYSNRYNEDDEQERDAAFDDAYINFPNCYIEAL